MVVGGAENVIDYTRGSAVATFFARLQSIHKYLFVRHVLQYRAPAVEEVEFEEGNIWEGSNNTTGWEIP